MSAERIAELERQLLFASEEQRKRDVSISIAQDCLRRILDEVCAPDYSRRALEGVASRGEFTVPDQGPIWKHIAPTYKVAELADYAFRALEES